MTASVTAKFMTAFDSRCSFRLRAVLSWLTVSCVTGCLGQSHSRTLHGEAVSELEAHCARATMGRYSPYRMPLADPVSDPAAAHWLDILPPVARRTARAAGLEPLLVKLLRPPTQSALPHDALSNSPEGQQELTLRLVAFDSQVSALSFETECTRRRVGELVRDLDTQEGERQLGLATASLVIGASTGIAAGALDLTGTQTDLPAILAVAGSAVSAGLGIAALLVPERAVRLQHRHNLLRPIFEGTDPEHLYPSFVFRMLTHHYQPNEPAAPRELLLQDFERVLTSAVPWGQWQQARAIMFGHGGLYSRELLAAREQMLQSLQQAVQGVARDLELFDRSIVRVLTQPIQHTRKAPGRNFTSATLGCNARPLDRSRSVP